MRYGKVLTTISALIVSLATLSGAQDPGWPRKNVQPGGALFSYQPQVDDWKDFTDITWRQAFQLTPAGGKQVVGAATLNAPHEICLPLTRRFHAFSDS